MTSVSYGSCGSATLIWNTAFQSSAFARSANMAQDVYVPSPSSLIFFGSSSFVPVELPSPFSPETLFPPKGGSKSFNGSKVSRYKYHDRFTIKTGREKGHSRGGVFTSWISSPIVETQVIQIIQFHRDWRKSRKDSMVMADRYRIRMKEGERAKVKTRD